MLTKTKKVIPSIAVCASAKDSLVEFSVRLRLVLRRWLLERSTMWIPFKMRMMDMFGYISVTRDLTHWQVTNSLSF